MKPSVSGGSTRNPSEATGSNAKHEHEWVGERNVKDAPNATMQMRCSICDVPAPNAKTSKSDKAS